MKNRNAEETRRHILATAETLFAKKGFDATSVDSIARTAGVNKALIYYYFKNKQDIIENLFNALRQELVSDRRSSGAENAPLAEKIQQEINFLSGKKPTLSLLIMDAMKEEADGHFLFQIAKKEIEGELLKRGFSATSEDPEKRQKFKQALVHEFFTGFLPVVNFIILKNKFSEYFDLKDEELQALFMQAFEKAHLASHVSAE